MNLNLYYNSRYYNDRRLLENRSARVSGPLTKGDMCGYYEPLNDVFDVSEFDLRYQYQY